MAALGRKMLRVCALYSNAWSRESWVCVIRLKHPDTEAYLSTTSAHPYTVTLSPLPVVFSSDTLIDFTAHNRFSDLFDRLSYIL